jgi:hypothetical protein
MPHPPDWNTVFQGPALDAHKTKSLARVGPPVLRSRHRDFQSRAPASAADSWAACRGGEPAPDLRSEVQSQRDTLEASKGGGRDA